MSALAAQAASRSSAVRTIFSWTIFPIALFGSVALSIAAFESGGSAPLALLLGLGFGYPVVLPGERIQPYAPD